MGDARSVFCGKSVGNERVEKWCCGRGEAVMSLVVCVSVKAVTPVVGGTSSLTDGDSASLTCTTASSLSSGVTYEWFLGGVAISGATSSPYTTAVSMSDDGNAYTCKVTFNGVTSDVSSNTVTLTGEPKRSF